MNMIRMMQVKGFFLIRQCVKHVTYQEGLEKEIAFEC